MLQVLWQRQVGKLPLEVTVPELYMWCWVNPEEANIVTLQTFLSHDIFFGGGGGGDYISKNGKAGLRNVTCLWLLIFLGKLFFKSFCSSCVSFCPRCFLIYIQRVEICFSPDCGRQNSEMLLRIHHTLSPSIYAPSNPWDCKLDSFYSHD